MRLRTVLVATAVIAVATACQPSRPNTSLANPAQKAYADWLTTVDFAVQNLDRASAKVYGDLSTHDLGRFNADLLQLDQALKDQSLNSSINATGMAKNWADELPAVQAYWEKFVTDEHKFDAAARQWSGLSNDVNLNAARKFFDDAGVDYTNMTEAAAKL